MVRIYVACVVALFTTASGVSRGEDLKTNEPTQGRIAKEGGSQVWVVEVADNATIRFEVTCKTGKLQAELFQDGKTKKDLTGVNGKGWPQHAAAWVYMGDREDSLEAQSKKLPAGKYTIKISGREQSEQGPYIITLLDPVFEPKKVDRNPEPAVTAPTPLSVRPGVQTDLHKRVDDLEKKIDDLVTRMKLLEKLIVERK